MIEIARQDAKNQALSHQIAGTKDESNERDLPNFDTGVPLDLFVTTNAILKEKHPEV